MFRPFPVSFNHLITYISWIAKRGSTAKPTISASASAQRLLDRQEALNQELKARKKELQDAQRRQRDNLKRQIRRAQSRVSAAPAA